MGIEIRSPLSGRVVSLSSLSDQAFAEKMMGEGVAIIPDGGTIFSPFPGVVETVAETGHAVGLLSDDGIELLIHIGIETVKLKGSAFTVRVAEGERVEAGSPLIDFDAGLIAAAGLDTATPVTVINGDAFDVEPSGGSDRGGGSDRSDRSDRIVQGDPLLVARRRGQ